MRLAGILESGETATADEINDGLSVLNDVIEGWNTGTLSVWQSANQAFPLIAGQSTYTIGTGGDFNTPRPVRIEGAYTTVQGVDFPIRIIDQLEFNLIPLKTMQQQIPLEMVYQNDMPLGRIILWPTPSAVVNLTLSLQTQITAIPNTSTVITYPPGANKALRYTLAVELAGEFGTQVPQVVMQTYMQCVADYKRANKRQVSVQFDQAFRGDGYAFWQTGGNW